MGKVYRLTESELVNVIKKLISEQNQQPTNVKPTVDLNKQNFIYSIQQQPDGSWIYVKDGEVVGQSPFRKIPKEQKVILPNPNVISGEYQPGDILVIDSTSGGWGGSHRYNVTKGVNIVQWFKQRYKK